MCVLEGQKRKVKEVRESVLVVIFTSRAVEM